MKIIIFGSSSLTLPGFLFLARHGLVAGLCTEEHDHEDAVKIRLHADQLNIKQITVTKKQVNKALVSWLESIAPDLILVMTFGLILPHKLLRLPPLGVYNVHFAKLPQYRGPAPIFWELLNNESEGAICIHKMTGKVDQGPVVINHPVPMHADDTYGTHLQRLAEQSIPVLQQFFSLLEGGLLEQAMQQQKNELARYYPRPQQSDVTIKWNPAIGRGNLSSSQCLQSLE